MLPAAGGEPLSIIDARSDRLPDRLTGLTLLAVLVALAAAAGLTVGAVVGSAAAYGPGDVKLALPVGAVLGWLGVLPWLTGLLGAHLLYVAVFAGRAMAGRTGWR